MGNWKQCIEAAKHDVHILQDEDIEPLHRLLDAENENTKNLWKILARQSSIASTINNTGPSNGAEMYARTCRIILHDWKIHPKKGKAEHRKDLLLIAKKSQELKALLIDENLAPPDIVKIGLFAALHHGYTPEYNELGGESLLLRGIIKNDEYLDNANIATNNAWKRRSQFSHDNENPLNESGLLDESQLPHDGDWLLIRLMSSNLISILDFVAAEAKHLTKQELTVKQPNTKNAPIIYFVRKLHEYHISRFGTPLWEALSLAATICFDLPTPLEPSSIRPWFT